MNRRTTILAAAAMAVAFNSVALAQPATCDTTYTGPNNGAWQTDTNWDNFAPTSSSVACVPDAKSVIVWTGKCDGGDDDGDYCELDANCAGGGTCDTTQAPDAVCKALNIARGESTTGHVKVYIGASLTLQGPTKSTIDGVLTFNRVGGSANHALKLGSDVTIEGEGGTIIGNPYDPYTTIESTGGGPYTLTLQYTGPDNDSRSNSITLQNAWIVEVGLQNDGYVLANYDELELNQTPVSGSGHWIADFFFVETGELVVNVEVTGSGTWHVDNTWNTPNFARIIFNADCPDLTGDFNLDVGTLEINADVVTTGDLKMESIDDSTPQITVAAGASIEFNAAP